MKYSELSLKSLREVSIEAAKDIKEKKDIDLIIYVARAGLPIAVYMNEVFDVPLLGIGAQRKGNWIKTQIGPLVAFFPRLLRDMIITFELKSKIHKKDNKRKVEFHQSIKDIDVNKIWTILIVDDSVDTGNSMRLVYELVAKTFINSKIYTYSLNIWNESREIFSTDYCSYEETVIKTPMSKDSKEYKSFCQMYEEITENGYL